MAINKLNIIPSYPRSTLNLMYKNVYNPNNKYLVKCKSNKKETCLHQQKQKQKHENPVVAMCSFFA